MPLVNITSTTDIAIDATKGNVALGATKGKVTLNGASVAIQAKCPLVAESKGAVRLRGAVANVHGKLVELG